MIRFTAKTVEAFSTEFCKDFVVFNIFFEECDREEGGQSWSFQRALGADGTIESREEEDEGVCTVKEIQQLTLYEGIERVKLSRNKFVCKFNIEAIQQIKIEGLEIDYSIDDDRWKRLIRIAVLVFRNRDYFRIARSLG
ncbi:MAG: hypothetical protein ACFBSE_17575 [Prochloraceae cyanobacterium]